MAKNKKKTITSLDCNGHGEDLCFDDNSTVDDFVCHIRGREEHFKGLGYTTVMVKLYESWGENELHIYAERLETDKEYSKRLEKEEAARVKAVKANRIKRDKDLLRLTKKKLKQEASLAGTVAELEVLDPQHLFIYTKE